MSCNHNKKTTKNELDQIDVFRFTRDMFEIQYVPASVNFDTSHGPIQTFLSALSEQDFSRSNMGKMNTNVTDLNERASWTFNDTVELYHYLGVYNSLKYKLLKYEEGDFFNLHKDSQGSHTVLMFCPSDFEGGDLILKKDNAFELKIKPSAVKNSFMIVKFSTDFLHEVTPITKGTRYVFKSHIELPDNSEFMVNEDWSGGLDCTYDSEDDY